MAFESIIAHPKGRPAVFDENLAAFAFPRECAALRSVLSPPLLDGSGDRSQVGQIEREPAHDLKTISDLGHCFPTQGIDERIVFMRDEPDTKCLRVVMQRTEPVKFDI